VFVRSVHCIFTFVGYTEVIPNQAIFVSFNGHVLYVGLEASLSYLDRRETLVWIVGPHRRNRLGC
jgi:hypothetical protein